MACRAEKPGMNLFKAKLATPLGKDGAVLSISG
jgi:hypothetical protein